MMKLRRTLCFVVAISIVFGCVGMVAAEDVPKVAAVERATGSFKTTVKPGVIAKRTTKLPLEAGEEVTIKATYSPYSVSVDVGLIDSDGIFHFITVSDGIIDEKIAVTERGNYTFAIRRPYASLSIKKHDLYACYGCCYTCSVLLYDGRTISKGER